MSAFKVQIIDLNCLTRLYENIFADQILYFLKKCTIFYIDIKLLDFKILNHTKEPYKIIKFGS